MKNLVFPTLVLTLSLMLGGCSSISKGVAEAVLEHEPRDERLCEITGKPFTGVRQSMMTQDDSKPGHSTKIMMVHGISKHLPGYSARLREQLMRTLALDVLEEKVKEIQITSPKYLMPDHTRENLGTLQVYRYTDAIRKHEILFYELTWSPITETRKEIIEYDDASANTYKRAGVNEIMKKFMNSTVPDLLIYMDAKRGQINESVGQSICWMFQGDWDSLPDKGAQYCDLNKTDVSGVIAEDDFFFITHSLGSRITIDTIQNYADTINSNGMQPNMKRMTDTIREKEMTVFMLANQLPLLQLAHKNPAVTDKLGEYCGPGAPRTGERIIRDLNIVAFSDPNDILSYPVHPHFAQNYMDSRICPDVMNVSLNVAPVRNIFGATNFADPLAAHSNYMADERVIGLIADGISRDHQSRAVAERCEWVEIKP